MLKWAWGIAQIPFMGYMSIPFIFVLLYFLLRLFHAKTPFEKRKKVSDKDYDFALIITAHQDTRFVFPLVDSILKQTYQKFRVYVVADDCLGLPVDFASDKIIVLQPEIALHSKIKSIRFAVDNFLPTHENMIILDADNLLHPNFLDQINKFFQKGYKVVQADFKPKNINTDFARMDAMGDMFNFFLEREMRMRLNLSAAIWGSGIAMDIRLYNEVEYLHLLGGFDKKLQTHLVKSVDRIGFSNDIILFDEKIETGEGLEKQRTRWISSYFKYFKESFQLWLLGIRKLDFNLIYFGYIIMRPPLFIVLLVSFLAMLIDYWVIPAFFWVWLGIGISFVLGFISIILLKGKDARFLSTLFKLPFFVARQMAALFQIGKAKRSFIKTEHTQLIYIDDLLPK